MEQDHAHWAVSCIGRQGTEVHAPILHAASALP
jgi:hypothetical protein